MQLRSKQPWIKATECVRRCPWKTDHTLTWIEPQRMLTCSEFLGERPSPGVGVRLSHTIHCSTCFCSFCLKALGLTIHGMRHQLRDTLETRNPGCGSSWSSAESQVNKEENTAWHLTFRCAPQTCTSYCDCYGPTHYKSLRAKSKPAVVLSCIIQTPCGLQTLPFRNSASLVAAGFALTICIQEIS